MGSRPCIPTLHRIHAYHTLSSNNSCRPCSQDPALHTNYSTTAIILCQPKWHSHWSGPCCIPQDPWFKNIIKASRSKCTWHTVQHHLKEACFQVDTALSH